jgi:predicted carbohydrate-binding protein with CBM48
MFEQHEDLVERIVRHLRRPIQIDPGLDARVMQQIAALPARGGAGRAATAWRWLTQSRRVSLSPLTGLAAAAAVVLLAVVPSWRRLRAPAEPASREFQFVLVAPRAATVSLVGDFNDWDVARTPMRPVRADGSVWSAVVPLPPGRYRYAFLVNGSQWLADPSAPAALDDEFGAPSSVVTVGGGGA